MKYSELLQKMDNRTNVYKCLRYMLSHGSITSMEAFTELNNTRLSATIHELRKRYNVPVAMTWAQTANGKKYGIYYIEED